MGGPETAIAQMLSHGVWPLVLNLILVIIAVIVIWRTLAHQLRKQIQREKAHVAQLQMQLVEMGKLAAMGELSAAVAHEINNPLSIMMENSGWIQDLLDTEDLRTPETRAEIEDSLKTIITQGQRCREITQNLLNFAHKPENAPQIVDINAFLTDIIGYARQKTRHDQIKILDELSPHTGSVLASPAELQQVVLNLVNNAIDALKNSDGYVRIRSFADAQNVQIMIQDNGQGMDEQVLKHIFEPFFTTKPKGKGTGLGLSICRDLVEKFGGTITVHSELNKGTIFRIRLPRHRA